MNKGHGGLGNIMKQARVMQQKIQKLQEEMATKTVEADAGGGMVKVIASGKQEIVKIKIEPAVVDPKDIGMLEDLIVAAVNKALERAQEMVNEEMSKITGGINIPGLF